MTNMVHSDVWEGPCRFNVVAVAQEAENVKNSFARWTRNVKDGRFALGDGVERLEPRLVLFDEAFTLPPAELLPLDQSKDRIDAFFISPDGASFAAAEIARRYHKPVVLLGLNCRTVDIAAYAKTLGEEVFVAADNAELERQFALLRARAVYRETRVLFPTDRGFPSVASLTGIADLPDLEKRHGVQVRMISYRLLAEEMERTLADRERLAQAERGADELIRAAQHSWVDRQYVVRSLQFRQAVEALMATHACNAFTIECFEFCSSRLPEKWKITPCLVHTLFKDAGYASACEGDLGALLATRLLLSVSGKSSHMGNMFTGKENTVVINHSVPGIRMNGFETPGLPYKLGRFVKSGWGTKAVVYFLDNPEKQVTVARLHPSAGKLLVMRGLLVGSEGWDQDNLGCSVTAIIRPRESGQGDRFIRRQTEYGNHLSWVYGDYSSELRDLGRLLGLEVELIS
jgi:L-fucose isomerase-like protein